MLNLGNAFVACYHIFCHVDRTLCCMSKFENGRVAKASFRVSNMKNNGCVAVSILWV